jgi:ketosteroid isomerase-like protein
MAEDLLAINQKLLNSIVSGDYATYDSLCADDITCIEEESNNSVVAGKQFHKFYFDMPKGDGNKFVQTSMANQHVRLLADGTVGILSYIRLTQSIKADGTPITSQSSETRIWENRNGKWLHTHVHRS